MAYYPHPEPRRDSMIGYHGTSASAASQILSSGFTPSAGDGDWLGHGVYFWSEPDAAQMWAERCHKLTQCRVVKATLHLGYCLNLDNTSPIAEFLKEVADQLCRELESDEKPIPQNVGHQRCFDCAWFNRAANCTGPETESIVRTCPAGDRIVAASELTEATRLQICMRSLDCIKHPQLHTGYGP